jgi:DNA primase
MAVLRSDPYFKNSTTTLGSNISTYQEKQIRTIPDLIVILDNDKAGEKYLKLMREVRKGLKTRAMRLDAPIKDVDEIPTKLGISVKQFREKGKFLLEQNSDFN